MSNSIEPRIPSVIWVTKDKKHLDIDDMGYNHVRNSCMLLMRRYCQQTPEEALSHVDRCNEPQVRLLLKYLKALIVESENNNPEIAFQVWLHMPEHLQCHHDPLEIEDRDFEEDADRVVLEGIVKQQIPWVLDVTKYIC